MKTKFNLILVLAVLCSLSGCGIFRKGCDCPKVSMALHANRLARV